jgi:hypothetical protein
MNALPHKAGQAAIFPGPTHKDTDGLKNVYRDRLGNARLRCVMAGYTGGTAFSLALLKEESIL